jgi:ubiquinone/menaquinone biosynthesis C-methylase UbiE
MSQESNDPLPIKSSKKQRMKESYDQTAEHYDLRYEPIQAKKLDLLFQKLNPIQGTILDYGAGTGLLWDYILHRNLFYKNSDEKTQWQYIALDISIEMLKIFQKRIDLSKLPKVKKKSSIKKKKLDNLNIWLKNSTALVCADGENLPFRPGVFDQVYAITSLQNLNDMDQGLQEIERISNTKRQIGFTILKKGYSQEELLLQLQKNFPQMKDIKMTIDLDNPNEYIEDYLYFN